MTIYISNAFSLSMLPALRRDAHHEIHEGDPISTEIEVIPILDPADWLRDAESRHGDPAVSAVGHADTARLFSSVLDRQIEPNRINVELGDDDELLVGQYVGPRLPEWATELPKGAVIHWMSVHMG